MMRSDCFFTAHGPQARVMGTSGKSLMSRRAVRHRAQERSTRTLEQGVITSKMPIHEAKIDVHNELRSGHSSTVLDSRTFG